MTKADIAEKLFERRFGSKKECQEAIDAAFDLIKEVIVREGRLKIAGFGNFTVRTKSPRKGRNPQTGEQIVIEGRKVLTYKPSHVLKSSLNTQD